MIQKMTYADLRDMFVAHNKTHLTKPISGYIVFSGDSWPNRNYSLPSRTYEISSDNKVFRSSCCSSSLFGFCTDGSDQGVRLDWYMKDLGIKNGWIVDYCYLKEDDSND